MLSAAVLSATMNCFSPSRNPCRIRDGAAMYHNDPYRATVISSPYKLDTPMAKAARELQRVESQGLIFGAAHRYDASAATTNILAADESYSAANHCAAGTARRSSITSQDGSETSSNGTVLSVAAQSSAPSATAPNSRFVIVQFKHETCMYRAPFRVAIGDTVVVEADRGENIGTVAEICDAAPTYEVPNRVSRRASPDEIAQLSALREQEKQTTLDVQKAAESVGLGIRVVDTEFQTDMNKLTVYFSSRAPVDFRKLQRTLFREFRCRIWLVNWSEVEFRKRQADRCLGISICSKLGSRLSSVKQATHNARRH